MALTFWFILLVIQAMSFTLVSRARNSTSIGYHGIVSVFTNGIWFVSQFFLIGFMAKPNMPMSTILLYGVVYITGTTLGSVLMHYVAMRWLETGKRKVES